MKFIKVKNTDGKEVLVNLDNVSHFFQTSETETTICFITYEDYIKVNLSIDEIHQVLNVIANSTVADLFIQ